MALSESQRKKIEEEEAYRAELRTSPKQDKKRGFGCLPILLILILAPLILIAIFGSFTPPSGDTSSAPVETPKDLEGNVNFDGSQVHITNEENEAWTKCWFTLNGDYHFPTDAPSSFIEDIQAGGTYTISIGEFTKGDGERFNPFSYKAKDFAASCDKRFGYWGW